jgi:hypothetical protein
LDWKKCIVDMLLFHGGGERTGSSDCRLHCKLLILEEDAYTLHIRATGP